MIIPDPLADQYVGCFNDYGTTRDVGSGLSPQVIEPMTVGLCIQKCVSLTLTYAALQVKILSDITGY